MLAVNHTTFFKIFIPRWFSCLESSQIASKFTLRVSQLPYQNTMVGWPFSSRQSLYC
jgi:hypothetical protein